MSYQTEKYAESLAEFGTPLWLPSCRGWVLQRAIPFRSGPVRPGCGLVDAMGCYPLFSCENWDGLGEDLAELRDSHLASLTLVCDPLTHPEPKNRREWFPQVARPFKEHFLVDLNRPAEELGSAHHRRNARRFTGQGQVEICSRPLDELDRWTELYAHLIARHRITGIARFSAESFRRQLALPGVTLLRALTSAGELAGMQIWVSHRKYAWYHLGAYNDLGYRLGGTSAALTAAALRHFQEQGARLANLGSGAGLANDPGDGLARYKRGWATETRWAWLCGVVLDGAAYREACDQWARPGNETEFFPAYRAPFQARAKAPQEVVHGHAD